MLWICFLPTFTVQVHMDNILYILEDIMLTGVATLGTFFFMIQVGYSYV